MATQKAKGKETGKDIEVDVLVSKTELFIQKNTKKITYVIVGIAVLAAVIFGIKYGYLVPREKKAAVALFPGEQYFAKDSFNLALNGNGVGYEGLISIVNKYGSTKSGNLAKAYAGVCYYKMGDNANALKYLKSFKVKDNMVSPAIVGLIGDCYVNMGKVKDGIGYFEKAASEADNEVVSPVYLKKAGIAYENLKEYSKAVKVYTEIKEKYFNSMEAQDIDKYITRAQALGGK